MAISTSDCSKGKSMVEFEVNDAGTVGGKARALTEADPDCVNFTRNALVTCSEPLGMHNSRCLVRSTTSPC